MSRILCIHLPLWPIQRQIAARPELRRQPVILHARDGSRGERVVVCSPAAQRGGVRAGMPLAEAVSVATSNLTSRKKSSTPGQAHKLAACGYDPNGDREAMKELAVLCGQFSPVVGLEDAAEPNCLLLDISGVAMLFGGEEKLLAKVHQQFEQRGYHVQLGVGETIGQAWAVAQCGMRSAECGVNTDSAFRIPHSALRLPKATLELLDELGITNVGQLLALPRDTLASRFGDLLVKRLNQFEGKTPEVIIAHQASEPFTANWSLEYPTDQRAAVEKILGFLVERLSHQLDDQDRGAVQIQCRIAIVDHPAVSFTLGLYQPSACAAHLSQLVQLQLEGQRWPGLVSDVRMQAVTTAPLEVTQGELFPDQQREATRKLALLVDRLSSRLGRDRVLTAKPQSDALPERAVRYAPAVAVKKKTRRTKQTPPAALSRPLTLHDPPQAIETLAIAPDGPPQRFQFDGCPQVITHCRGPERIETSWWRGRTVRRDYWRVETEAGGRFWLFRRLGDRRWFLHGEFV